MLKLTVSELDAVFSAARPLDPDLTDPFLQAVANALIADCSGEVGPGTVGRVCRELQKQYFDPPIITEPVGWERRGGAIRPLRRRAIADG